MNDVDLGRTVETVMAIFAGWTSTFLPKSLTVTA
jgi:hypothetical protein